MDNVSIINLGVFPTPSPSDPWHIAHSRVCAHASTACAACSVAYVCCSCRALRFTPGVAPTATTTPAPLQRSRSASPALFRLDVGNGTPPPEFDSHCDNYDDDAYVQALADSDTCDNSSCPNGPDAPARYSIVVETFDDGIEEFYDRTYHACATCNRSCKKSFLGNRIKSRTFDNSARNKAQAATPLTTACSSCTFDYSTRKSLEARSKQSENSARTAPVNRTRTPEPLPQSNSSPSGPPSGDTDLVLDELADPPAPALTPPLEVITALQDSLRTLNDRPLTPAMFVTTIRVKHDASCSHPTDTCPVCSRGLICCSCLRLFAPAVSRHLKCTNCKHAASSCCASAYCCKCSKLWSPSDSIVPVQIPAWRFYGGTGSNTTSSLEPDIWTPSPRSSPDEIDDLTTCANVPLPASRSESNASRAPSHASSMDEPVNVAATPLPTPDYSSLSEELVDGFLHPSFPERAVLDNKDKQHFLGRGDLSVTSLKLYA